MSQSPWIMSHRERPKYRLFCFPYAGGGAAAIYRTWQQGLPPEVEVCPILLPGRENRFTEPAYVQVEILVQKLSEEILPYLNVPFQFFGHSMGALISFELTRQLRRQQRPQPTQLFVSAHRAPQITRRQKPVHALPEKDFIESIKELGGTPEAILQNNELMQLFLPILRADFELCEVYQHKTEAPLAIPITAFGGLEDKDVPVADLEAWHTQTISAFSMQTFAGGHFYLHPYQKQLLQTISAFYS
jgi:medium-chain acyl-[acyl-carrier-protein] hydrolase